MLTSLWLPYKERNGATGDVGVLLLTKLKHILEEWLTPKAPELNKVKRVMVSIKNTACDDAVPLIYRRRMITDCVQVFIVPVISWKSSAAPERLLKGDMISFWFFFLTSTSPCSSGSCLEDKAQIVKLSRDG